MHPEDIKSGIRKRFGSLAEFERLNNLPTGAARDVLRGKSRSETAEAMAAALGVAVKAISHHQKSGKSKSSTDHKSANADLHHQNAGAK